MFLRIPNFTSRRKTTPPPEQPVTRIPPRRRLKPFPSEDDQEVVGFETERPEVFLQREEEEGISVQPVSTVSQLWPEDYKKSQSDGLLKDY